MIQIGATVFRSDDLCIRVDIQDTVFETVQISGIYKVCLVHKNNIDECNFVIGPRDQQKVYGTGAGSAQIVDNKRGFFAMAVSEYSLRRLVFPAPKKICLNSDRNSFGMFYGFWL